MPVDERILDAQLPCLLGGADPIQIEMPDRRRACIVDLHEREGRARDLVLVAARPDEGARKGGFPGAEVALQRNDVGRGGHRGDAGRERGGGSFVRQIDNNHRLGVV